MDPKDQNDMWEQDNEDAILGNTITEEPAPEPVPEEEEP